MAENIIATVGFQVDTSDLAKLNKQLDDIQKNAQQAGMQVDKIGKGGASAGSRVGGFASKIAVGIGAIGAAAVAASGAIGAFVMSSINRLNEMNDAAKRAGLSLEKFSELKFAADFSGTNIDTVSKGLLKLGEDAARGGKKLAALGINVRDANGQIKSSDALLLEVADKFKEYADGTQEAALAAELFGQHAGPELQILLNKGSEGIKALQEEAKELGAVMSGYVAEQAGEFNDNLQRLSLLAKGFGNDLAAELLPALNAFTSEMVEFGKETRKTSGGFVELLGSIVRFVARAAIGLKTFVQMVAVGFGFIVEVATKVGDAFFNIGDNLSAVARAAKAAFSGNFGEAYDILERRSAEAREKVLKLPEEISRAWGVAKEMLSEYALNGAEQIEALSEESAAAAREARRLAEAAEAAGKASGSIGKQAPSIGESAAATKRLADETRRFASELERIRGLSNEASEAGRKLFNDIAKSISSVNRVVIPNVFGDTTVSASDALQEIRSSHSRFIDEIDSQIGSIYVTLFDFMKKIDSAAELDFAKLFIEQLNVLSENADYKKLEQFVQYAQLLVELSQELQRAYTAELEAGGQVDPDFERKIALITELSARVGNIVELNKQLNKLYDGGFYEKSTERIANKAKEEEYSRIILELDKQISQENSIQQQIKDGLITSQDELARILEVEAELQSLINELQQKGITLEEWQTKAIEERIRKRREEADETNKELRKREELDKFLEETIGSVGDLLADSITQGLETGKFSFKQFLYDLGKMLLSSSIKQIFASLFEVDIKTGKGGGWLSAIGQVITGFFTKGAAKNGGIFSPEGAKFFANGGIVNKRTQFAHSGGIGIMGEAGPEAIIPLAKTTDGKLGVRAMGGSGSTNIQNFKMAENITIQVQSTDNAQRDDAETAKAIDRLLNIKFKQFIQEQQRPGNMLSPRLGQ